MLGFLFELQILNSFFQAISTLLSLRPSCRRFNMPCLRDTMVLLWTTF